MLIAKTSQGKACFYIHLDANHEPLSTDASSLLRSLPFPLLLSTLLPYLRLIGTQAHRPCDARSLILPQLQVLASWAV